MSRQQKIDSGTNVSVEKETTDIDNMQAEEILLNLKIISQIKENEKLSTNMEQLSIDQSMCQFLTRAYYGNSRDTTLKMIDNVVTNALELTDKTLNQGLNNSDNVKKEKNILNEEPSHLLHRFLLQMSNAIKGLENLKVTYKDDVSVQSKLDLINEKMAMRIEKINKILTINI